MNLDIEGIENSEPSKQPEVLNKLPVSPLATRLQNFTQLKFKKQMAVKHVKLKLSVSPKYPVKKKLPGNLESSFDFDELMDGSNLHKRQTSRDI